MLDAVRDMGGVLEKRCRAGVCSEAASAADRGCQQRAGEGIVHITK